MWWESLSNIGIVCDRAPSLEQEGVILSAESRAKVYRKTSSLDG